MSHVTTCLSVTQLEILEHTTNVLRRQGVNPSQARRIAYAEMLADCLPAAHPVSRYYDHRYQAVTPYHEQRLSR